MIALKLCTTEGNHNLFTRKLHSYAFRLNKAKMDRSCDDLIYHGISNILNRKVMPDMC